MSQKNKNISILVLLFLFLGGGVVIPVLASSDSITNLAQQKNDLQDQYDNLTAKIKAYNQIIELKQRQGATLSDQLTGLQAQIEKMQLEIDDTTQKIATLQKQIQTLSVRIAEQSILIERQKKMLTELMRVYYTNYTGDALPLLFTSTETLLYFKSEDWTADVSNKVTDLLSSVKALRDSLTQEQAEVTAKKQQVDTLYQDLAARNQLLEAAKKNKGALLAKTQAEAVKYGNLVDDLQKQRDDIEQEIQDLEADKSGNLSGMPSAEHGLLSYPVKEVNISQGYGKTSYSKKAYKSGVHNGLDLTGSSGTTLYAAGNGKVVDTGNLGRYAYGKWVAIDHGNGIVTLYGHMSSIGVSAGDKVSKGDKIGNMGSTGYSTGNHVHFSVFSKNSYEVVESSTIKGLKIPIGATVNPSIYLP